MLRRRYLRKRGFMMKYEKPNLELIILELGDVITLSSEYEGDNEGTPGPWS